MATHSYINESGQEVTLRIEPGAVVVSMLFGVAGDQCRMHSHTFDHWMTCIKGRARIYLNGVESIIGPGERALIEAHRQHGLWALEGGTVVECRHEHADIHPDKTDGSGIPLEWLWRLTDEVSA